MEFLELVNQIMGLLDTDLLINIATFIGSCRLVMKPVCTFWQKKINPYVSIKPKQKLLGHPLYKSAIFFIDWAFSLKMPKEEE